MSRATPAVDFITALDAPLDVLRRDFGKWAPTLAILIYSGILLQIPAQFANRWMMEDLQSGEVEAMFAWLPLILGTSCIAFPVLMVGVAAEGVCVGHVVAGRPAGVMDSLRPLGTVNYWIALVISGTFSVIGGLAACLTCGIGGLLVWVPLGLILPVALEEKLGLGSVQRALDLGLMRTGPAWYDRPGFKVGALTLAYGVLTLAAGAVAQVPVFGSMGWEFYDAITSGDPERLATLGTVNPWAATVGMLLGGAVRIFTDTYYWAGLFLIYADARERAGGAGLEAAIEGPST